MILGDVIVTATRGINQSDVCELQGILLSDDTTDSDTDSDDSDFTLSREELQDMLRLHKFTKLHQSKFHSDREVGSIRKWVSA